MVAVQTKNIKLECFWWVHVFHEAWYAMFVYLMFLVLRVLEICVYVCNCKQTQQNNKAKRRNCMEGSIYVWNICASVWVDCWLCVGFVASLFFSLLSLHLLTSARTHNAVFSLNSFPFLLSVVENKYKRSAHPTLTHRWIFKFKY